MSLKKQISQIPKPIKSTIKKRMNEFSSFKNKGNEEWFSELCFCLLTANSKAETAINIQKSLGHKGFSSLSQKSLANEIKNSKHRFHNNKAKYIVEARKFQKIKNHLSSDSFKSREFLVKNIKGLGMKEASHFLRNTGTKDLSILDRHIINYLVQEKYLKEKPKTLTPKRYLEIESKFINLAKSLGLPPAELDLNIWYLKTGTVLK